MNTRPDPFLHSTPVARLRTADECLFHWNLVIRTASDDWAKGFSKSIQGQSRRRGWQPTPKQLIFMRRMVSDLFVHRAEDEDDLSLIE